MNINKPTFEYNIKRKKKKIYIEIFPFKYENEMQPRLPRKQSKGYRLQKDTNSFFNEVLNEVESFYSSKSKFFIKILIYKGGDKLGTADLDNYAKAILDGITNTKKIWKDDKQVDKLLIKRIYFNYDISKIKLKIKKITPHNTIYSA